MCISAEAIDVERICSLTPSSSRHWGKMSVNEILCHLTDSYRCVIGERSVPSQALDSAPAFEMAGPRCSDEVAEKPANTPGE